MNSKDQTNPMRAQIYAKLQEKPTEELLKIWNQQDREEWTDLAFEVVGEILEVRLGSLPEPQNISSEEQEELSEAGKRLVRIANWARALSGAVLGLAIVTFFICLVMGITSGSSFGQFFILLVGSLLSLLWGGIFFVILQALSELLVLQKNVPDKRDR
jgi:hypothetical protein